MNTKTKSETKISEEIMAETVMTVLLEKQTVTEAAESLGVDAAEVDSWRAQYLKTVSASIKTKKPSVLGRIRNRPLGILATASTLALVLLFSSNVWSITEAPSTVDCLDADNPLVCFGPNTPAKANDVNYNFNKIIDLIESKIGPLANKELNLQANSDIKDVDRIYGDGALYLRGDDSSSADGIAIATDGKVTIPSLTVTGTLTGDITGDVTGDVTGNVTGKLNNLEIVSSPGNNGTVSCASWCVSSVAGYCIGAIQNSNGYGVNCDTVLGGDGTNTIRCICIRPYAE